VNGLDCSSYSVRIGHRVREELIMDSEKFVIDLA
jgi:hypothetical protein